MFNYEFAECDSAEYEEFLQVCNEVFAELDAEAREIDEQMAAPTDEEMEQMARDYGEA